MNQQLFQKIRTMKLRRISRHGTAVYRYEDAAAESSLCFLCRALRRGVIDDASDDHHIVVSFPKFGREKFTLTGSGRARCPPFSARCMVSHSMFRLY